MTKIDWHRDHWHALCLGNNIRFVHLLTSATLRFCFRVLWSSTVFVLAGSLLLSSGPENDSIIISSRYKIQPELLWRWQGSQGHDRTLKYICAALIKSVLLLLLAFTSRTVVSPWNYGHSICLNYVENVAIAKTFFLKKKAQKTLLFVFLMHDWVISISFIGCCLGNLFCKK